MVRCKLTARLLVNFILSIFIREIVVSNYEIIIYLLKLKWKKQWFSDYVPLWEFFSLLYLPLRKTHDSWYQYNIERNWNSVNHDLVSAGYKDWQNWTIFAFTIYNYESFIIEMSDKIQLIDGKNEKTSHYARECTFLYRGGTSIWCLLSKC